MIEFRFHGSAKYEIKKLIDEINKNFGLKSKRAIPHITLAGPFSTNDETRLIRDFDLLCSSYPLMSFEVAGFNTFDNSKVVFQRSKVFVTSDLHLDHANIIKYCKRPFLDTSDMNKTLIGN